MIRVDFFVKRKKILVPIALLCMLLVLAPIVIRARVWVGAPGELVAESDELIWRSPGEGPFRRIEGDAAKAIFRIRNVGGAVRVKEVQSSCGCATPKVYPTEIRPGTTGYVEVRALPLLHGERTALVKLRTDSPVSPELVLRLRIVGSRNPPYLAHVSGDLSFRETTSNPGSHRIQAINVESSDSIPTPPLLETDLSDVIRIGPPKLLEEQPYITAKAILRKHESEVQLLTKPQGEAVSGDVRIVDPWDRHHVERLRVHIELPPPIRVVPSRLILRKGDDGDSQRTEARFLVISQLPVEDLRIELEDVEDHPLSLGPLTAEQGAGKASFTVAIEPNSDRDGEYNIRVISRSTNDHVLVPVLIRQGDAR